MNKHVMACGENRMRVDYAEGRKNAKERRGKMKRIEMRIVAF